MAQDHHHVGLFLCAPDNRPESLDDWRGAIGTYPVTRGVVQKAFEQRTDKLVAQYDALEPAETPGQKVNGKLTLGENIGDLGGLSIAYAAYQLSQAGAEPDETGSERFFAAWAHAWATKTRPEEAARRLTIDPHSPPEFRCNAVVKNIDAFHATYDVQEGDGMWLAPDERVRIW